MAVSVKRFIHDEPGLFKATSEFVKLLTNVPDPVLQVAKKAPTVDGKIAWTLLGTVLFQNCSYSNFSALLNALYLKFPAEQLWALPAPREAEINQCVENVFGKNAWSLKEHVSGIIWSVGHFVRNQEDLARWVQSKIPQELWRDLGEIYFMGKGSPRPKACAAIYRLVSPAPVGLNLSMQGLEGDSKSKMPNLPLTMGARRYLAFLGPAKDTSFAELDASLKQKMANELFVALNPETPYTAAHALQFFLEDGKDGFICRVALDHCKRCPLYEYCNYAEHFSK